MGDVPEPAEEVRQPNFEAYARYTQLGELKGVNVIEGGQPGTKDDFLIIDWGKFRGLDAEGTKRLRDEFMSVASDGRFSDFSPQELQDSFDAKVRDAQSPEQNKEGGAVASYSQKISYLNSQGSDRDISSRFLFGGNIYADSAKESQLYAIWTREHEVAHEILGLSEAGADYVAAMRMRELHPGAETDAYLRREADMRAVRPFRVSREMVDVQENYGSGCVDAIEAALKKTPAEIKEAMDRGDFYYDSLKYEETNQRQAEFRPDKNVRYALRLENPHALDKDYAATDLRETAQRLIEKGVFPKGSDEDGLLRNLEAATGRVDAALEKYSAPAANSSPQAAPAPIPAPQM